MRDPAVDNHNPPQFKTIKVARNLPSNCGRVTDHIGSIDAKFRHFTPTKYHELWEVMPMAIPPRPSPSIASIYTSVPLALERPDSDKFSGCIRDCLKHWRTRAVGLPNLPEIPKTRGVYPLRIPRKFNKTPNAKLSAISSSNRLITPGRCATTVNSPLFVLNCGVIFPTL